MEFGLFLEFPCPPGGTEHDAFRDAFDLVDRAEEQGVDSVWSYLSKPAPQSAWFKKATVFARSGGIAMVGSRLFHH